MKVRTMPDDGFQVREQVPAAVYDLAMRLGVVPDTKRSNVSLTQTGRMKRQLGAASWMSFTAAQRFSTRNCEFKWQARFSPLGLVSAIDALEDDEGRLDVTALGFIPIARTVHSSALMRGELMRYMAELPWVPDAILLNPNLRWRVERSDQLAVSAGSGDTASEVILNLDNDGRIAGAFALDRPRSATPPILPTPWRGRFADYRHHNGCWIPFAGEVAWEIDGKEEVYWQGRIETWVTH